MDIRNYEYDQLGAPIVGAAVTVYTATLTHPPVTVETSGTTDGNGRWAFTGLASGVKDVKVVANGQTKWYKGKSQVGVNAVFFEDSAKFLQIATPGAPGANGSVLYFKADGLPYYRSGAAGAETKMMSGPDFTWTTFTPTLQQGGLAAITVTRARYLILGKIVLLSVSVLVTGIASVVANNSVRLILPTTTPNLTVAASGILTQGTALVFDAGTDFKVGALVADTTSSLAIYRDGKGDTIGTASDVYTLAVNDQLTYNAMAELA